MVMPWEISTKLVRTLSLNVQHQYGLPSFWNGSVPLLLSMNRLSVYFSFRSNSQMFTPKLRYQYINNSLPASPFLLFHLPSQFLFLFFFFPHNKCHCTIYTSIKCSRCSPQAHKLVLCSPLNKGDSFTIFTFLSSIN